MADTKALLDAAERARMEREMLRKEILTKQLHPNLFEQIADAQTPRAVKKKQERQERPEALIEKDKEKAALRKTYKAQQQKRLEEMLEGPWGAELESLITFLADLSIEEPEEVLDYMHRSRLRRADEETRYTALRLVDEAIISLRTRNGLPPVDDPLPGEDPNVFQIIKGILLP